MSFVTKGRPIGRRVAVHCEDCYVRGELVERTSGYEEHWPTIAPNCRRPPCELCPSMKAAFAQARAGSGQQKSLTPSPYGAALLRPVTYQWSARFVCIFNVSSQGH